MKLRLQQEENRSKSNTEDEGDSQRKSDRQRPISPDDLQISLKRWERRWTSWGVQSKRRQSGMWIDWSEQPIHLSLRQSWSVQCHRSFGCLNSSRSTGFRTPRTTLTPSRRHWAFSSPLTKYCVVPFPPLSKELQENGSQSCQHR